MAEDPTLNLQEICYDLTQAGINRLKSQIERNPVHSNWASQIGHPCSRYLYYNRVNWRDRDPHNFVLQSIFNEGTKHEKDTIREIQEDCDIRGWSIVAQQDRFYDEELQVGGRIDLDIIIPMDAGEIQTLPCEIKSCAPHTWNAIDTQEDILSAKQYYVRNYYDQLMAYLYMHNKEWGILVLKNKITGLRKYVPIRLDYDRFTDTIKKLEKLNENIKNKVPPDRLLDFDVCDECPFKKICITEDIKFELPKMDNDLLLQAITQKEAQKEAHKAYESAMKTIKEQCSRATEEQFTVGDYLVKRSWIGPKQIPSYLREGYWTNRIKSLVEKKKNET